MFPIDHATVAYDNNNNPWQGLSLAKLPWQGLSLTKAAGSSCMPWRSLPPPRRYRQRSWELRGSHVWQGLRDASLVVQCLSRDAKSALGANVILRYSVACHTSFSQSRSRHYLHYRKPCRTTMASLPPIAWFAARLGRVGPRPSCVVCSPEQRSRGWAVQENTKGFWKPLLVSTGLHCIVLFIIAVYQQRPSPRLCH